MTIRRLVFDFGVTGVLAMCAIVLQNWRWQPDVSDFIASYNHLIWAGFSATLFALVAIFEWKLLIRPALLVGKLAEIAIIILAADAAACLFYLVLHPMEDTRTVLGFALVFTFLPAVIASAVAFFLVAGVGRLLSTK